MHREAGPRCVRHLKRGVDPVEHGAHEPHPEASALRSLGRPILRQALAVVTDADPYLTVAPVTDADLNVPAAG